VVWRFETVNGCVTKVPNQARRPAAHASTRDKSTWAPFEVARATFLVGHGDGVGFVLTGTRFAAFGIDGCLSRDEGDG
jgi:primase-polymerase (primpol)-like protein